MSDVIGRLERVPLREVWKHEAYDFTVWLENNVDVVNEVTGLALTSIEREQLAGAFSIDLVAEEQGGGKVIIENQLEKSNHDHLGKLITYLSALNARAAVWIVSEPRPEHVAAVSWLNDSSSADFYLLKIEAVRIGSSPPAPLLTAIVRPSEDKPAISGANQNFAERHTLRTAWWKSLLAIVFARSRLSEGWHLASAISVETFDGKTDARVSFLEENRPPGRFRWVGTSPFLQRNATISYKGNLVSLPDDGSLEPTAITVKWLPS